MGMSEERQALRNEIAGVLLSHADELAARMEKAYVEQYPDSHANQMDAAKIHSWTLSEISDFADYLKTSDPTKRSFVGFYGDLFVDRHNQDLTPYVNYLTSMLFEARMIAPMIMAEYLGNPARARKLIDEFERAIQDLIVYNTGLYAEMATQRGAISRTWNLMSELPLESALPDTPAKRHGAKSLDAVNDAGASPKEGGRHFGAGERGNDVLPGADALTAREITVLEELLAGRSNQEIAANLSISQNTAKNHVSHIFEKYGVSSRAELLAFILG